MTAKIAKESQACCIILVAIEKLVIKFLQWLICTEPRWYSKIVVWTWSIYFKIISTFQSNIPVSTYRSPLKTIKIWGSYKPLPLTLPPKYFWVSECRTPRIGFKSGKSCSLYHLSKHNSFAYHNRYAMIYAEDRTCKDSLLVCVVKCSKRNWIYVACTREQSNYRFNMDRYDIEHNNSSSTEVGEHFISKYCNFEEQKLYNFRKYSVSATLSVFKMCKDYY